MKTRPTGPSDGLGSILAATSFGFVVIQLDVTIVNVALPRIAEDLRASVAALQWVVDAYTLAFAVLLLSAGVAGDLFGSRRMFVAGFLVFGTASLACGLSSTAAGLVAARTAQGIGAALLLPNSLSLLNHATAHEDSVRARAVGLWTAAGGVAITAGPVLGGLLLTGLGWRSIFLVNLPLCALAIWLTERAVPETPREHETRGLDLPGQLLAIVALTGLTGAVIELRPLGTTHPLVVGGAFLAVLAGLAFVVVEGRTKDPMVPLAFFRRPNFSPAVVFGILVNLTYYGAIFVLSLYLQKVRGYSAISAGLAFLPLTGTFILSNVLSGWMTGRMGSRVPMIVGALIGSGGYLLLSMLGRSSSYAQMLGPFLLIPIGMGLAVPAMTTCVLASVERARAGTASAVLNAARQAGGAIGVAIFGALAGSTVEHIASGLRSSALLSVGLLLAAAALAWVAVRPLSSQVSGRSEQQERTRASS
jgi:DHA2 family methylenomycin A resistance protein-like MFS transporter